MLQFRSFLNTDPPHLERIWQQLPELAGQLPELTSSRCEAEILSKPYFDPQGLILAWEKVDDFERPIGFVHAGFAKNSSGEDLDFSQGILSIVKVIDCPLLDAAVAGLLECGCRYLKSKGATLAHIGSRFPHAPFYSGIYGGSTVPGILETDSRCFGVLEKYGFQQVDRVVVWERVLADFRPIGGREQLAIRRKYQVNSVNDPQPKNWWQTCVYGVARRERFSIFDKKDQVVCGDVSFWDFGAMRSDRIRTRGAFDLNVPSEFRRSGIATFLLGDALKQLMQAGIELIEAQTLESDVPACGVFEKLGFQKIRHGILLTKAL